MKLAEKTNSLGKRGMKRVVYVICVFIISNLYDPAGYAAARNVTYRVELCSLVYRFKTSTKTNYELRKCLGNHEQ